MITTLWLCGRLFLGDSCRLLNYLGKKYHHQHITPYHQYHHILTTTMLAGYAWLQSSFRFFFFLNISIVQYDKAIWQDFKMLTKHFKTSLYISSSKQFQEKDTFIFTVSQF